MRPLTENETLVFNELTKRNEARVKSISNACDISIDHTEGFETLRQIQRNLTSGVQVRSQYRNLSLKDMKVKDFSKTQLLDLFEINQALIKIEDVKFMIFFISLDKSFILTNFKSTVFWPVFLQR